jgi:hypothetical protein
MVTSMQLKSFLLKWGLDNLKIKVPFLETELAFRTENQRAAWELYIEMLTRFVTQNLPDEHGSEMTALDSMYNLFPITHEILKKYGQNSVNFAKIAVPILNQKVRPFTAKWHPIMVEGNLTAKQKEDFRKEIKDVQLILAKYMRLLADMAGVEDLSDLADGWTIDST